MASASRCFQVELVGKLDNAASNGFDYKVTLFEGFIRAATTRPTCPFKLNIVDSDKGAAATTTAPRAPSTSAFRKGTNRPSP